MTDRQRMESDMATEDKRNTADKTLHDNRTRNDDLTRERRYMTDRTMDKNRTRNDEITANRRDVKDRGFNRVLAALTISLAALLVLEIGIYFIFI